MIQYWLVVTTCWVLFLFAYRLIFSNKTFFQFNRWYLWSTLILGLAIPLLAECVNPSDQILEIRSLVVPEIMIPSSSSNDSMKLNQFPWITIIYSLGLMIALLKLFTGLYKIYNFINSGDHKQENGYTIVTTDKVHLPFSFLHYIVISQHVDFENQWKEVVQHESAHIQQKHTIDIVLIELLQAILWFHPIIYVYKNEIKQAHEFYADAYVIQDSSKEQYTSLLLEHATSSLEMQLSNTLFNSKVKDRLIMIQKTKTSKYSKLLYLLLIPLIGILLYSFASDKEVEVENLEQITVIGHGESSDNSQKEEQEVEVKEKPFAVVEKMPMFPGCDDVSHYEDKRKCSNQKLLEYVYTNIKYPKVSRKAGTIGTAVVQFVVNKKGGIDDITIIRSVDKSIDQEVVRLVNQMSENITWNPGEQKGKLVDVKFTLPVKFVLEGDEPKKEKEEIENQESWKEITKELKSKTLDIQLYPNPTTEVVNVTVDEPVESGSTIVIYNKFGEVMQSVDITSNKTSLNIQNLPADNYILVVTSGKKTSSKHFVKK